MVANTALVALLTCSASQWLVFGVVLSDHLFVILFAASIAASAWAHGMNTFIQSTENRLSIALVGLSVAAAVASYAMQSL
jgi:hypothetical protein